MNENEIMVAGGNLPAATENRMLTIQEMKEQVQVVQQVMQYIMKPKAHYDKLPGCGDKPVLLKPGAEKIGMVFRIGSEPEIDRETDGFDTHFHIRCRMFDIRTGNTLGYGVGEGSTSESKWAWRRAICHEEFEATLETRRRIHWQKKYNSGGFEAVEQVRQNPADIINTVLKMALKRAEVDGIRKVTACSDVFDQDLDESHIREAVGVETPEPRYQQPQRKTATAPAAENPVPAAENTAPDAGDNVISEAQRKRLYAIGKSKNLTDKEMSFIVFQNAGVNNSKDIPRDKYDATVTAMNSAVSGAILPAE